MFKFELDVSDLLKKAEQWGAAAEQVPFALSRALNDAVTDAREHLVTQTWPRHVNVRNAAFIGWALRINYSTKYDLTAEIYDQTKGNVHLALHDKGGVKTTTQGRFVIPTSNVTMTSHGVRQSQKPVNLKNKVVIGNSIYQRQGSGKNKYLVKMFTIVRQVNQPADVPFTEDFQSVIRAKVDAYFLPRLLQAVATAKR